MIRQGAKESKRLFSLKTNNLTNNNDDKLKRNSLKSTRDLSQRRRDLMKKCKKWSCAFEENNEISNKESTCSSNFATTDESFASNLEIAATTNNSIATTNESMNNSPICEACIEEEENNIKFTYKLSTFMWQAMKDSLFSKCLNGRSN